MTPTMHRTAATLAVARVLLASPTNIHGYAVVRAVGHKPGAVYPILDRMCAAGWLADEWEAQADQGRPRRRYFTVTPEGSIELAKLLGEDADLHVLIEQTRAQLARLLAMTDSEPEAVS